MSEKLIQNSIDRIDTAAAPALVKLLKTVLPSSFFSEYTPLSLKEFETLLETNSLSVPCSRLHNHACSVEALKKALQIFKTSHRFILLIHLVTLFVF